MAEKGGSQSKYVDNSDDDNPSGRQAIWELEQELTTEELSKAIPLRHL